MAEARRQAQEQEAQERLLRGRLRCAGSVALNPPIAWGVSDAALWPYCLMAAAAERKQWEAEMLATHMSVERHRALMEAQKLSIESKVTTFD